VLLAPSAFPVIDQWTVIAIFGDDFGLRWQRATAYTAFTRRLRELASTFCPDARTILEVDQRVMNAMIGCSHARAACAHVPFPVIALDG